jgi:hypothetical protein
MPEGYALTDQATARVHTARAEQRAGTNPGGLMFPSPGGAYGRPVIEGKKETRQGVQTERSWAK